MSEFDNKVVIVTGAAGGLGRAVAQYFKGNGAAVVHVDYSDDILSKCFPEQNEPNCLYLSADLTSRESCVDCFSKVHEQFGRIDVLCNIAGGFLMGEPVHETSDKTWDFLFDLNTRSILNTSASVVPSMLQAGSGKIINIAAGAATKGAAKMGAYIASKSAVMRLTESMALELRESNINVNSIMPSVMDTPTNRADMPSADFSKWVQPNSVAQVIGFLASPAAKDIHGASIPVSGLN